MEESKRGCRARTLSLWVHDRYTPWARRFAPRGRALSSDLHIVQTFPDMPELAAKVDPPAHFGHFHNHPAADARDSK